MITSRIQKYRFLKSTKAIKYEKKTFAIKGLEGAREGIKNLIFITSSWESISVSKKAFMTSIRVIFEIPFVFFSFASSAFWWEWSGNPFHMTFLAPLPPKISLKLCVVSSCWLQKPHKIDIKRQQMRIISREISLWLFWSEARIFRMKFSSRIFPQSALYLQPSHEENNRFAEFARKYK